MMEKAVVAGRFENEENRQLAKVLTTLIWASWCGFLVVCISGILYNDRRLIVVTLAGCAGLFLPMVLLKRRHLHASSLFSTMIILVTVTFFATVGQGIRDLAIVTFPVLFIFAGLALDRKYFILCVGLALVAIGWLFFGETFGWFIPVPFTGGKWFYLIEVITILLIAAFAVNLLATNMRRNLEKARAEVALRKHMEMEVMQLNAGLEQRVEERTQELQETQEKLLRQEKLAVLGQMAGSVGHELRNPLGVISNSVYYLKMAQPEANEKIKKHLDLIEQQVHTSEKIIGDLLGFARNISVEQQELAVPELVRRVLERFPVPAGMGLTMELPEDLPHVVADPAQMEQVLGNLTTNACQAMQDGGILILSASLRKNEVAIAVKDSGTGITPENMQKLFEPLFTTKATGIGLGLAISKKLAEANGGRIEVKSEVGQGSTFTLYLPVKEGKV